MTRAGVDGPDEALMGEADWLWDRTLGCHIACCSQSSGYGHRCHNGPLTGGQLRDGDCGRHGYVGPETDADD